MTETSRVNVREVVEHSLTLRAFSIKRASLTSRFVAAEGKQFHVNGNRATLQQALLNLIVNAEQALAGVAGEILVELDADDGWTWIRIIDKGPGIAIQPPERAFEAFVSTHDAWDGAGLGLWAARTIAEEHGGSLTFQSSAEGTTVTMRLPKAA